MISSLMDFAAGMLPLQKGSTQKPGVSGCTPVTVCFLFIGTSGVIIFCILVKCMDVLDGRQTRKHRILRCFATTAKSANKILYLF